MIEANEIPGAVAPPAAMPDAEPMDLGRIAAICAEEIEAARERNKSTYRISPQRASDYFYGKMDEDTPPQPGRSKAQSNDVADVIGWMMPGLMRVFFSSDTFGEFQPVEEQDEAAAQQASDYINYVFLQECHGYVVGWNAMHDALMLRTGVIKFWWDDAPEYRVESFTGLSEERFIELVNEQDLDVLAHSVYPDTHWTPPPPPVVPQGPPQGPQEAPQPGVDPQATQGQEQPPGPPQPQQPPPPPQPPPERPNLHDLRIRKVIRNPRPRVMALPPEQFLIDAEATGTHDARFMAHWSQATRSELIRQGFDPQKVMDAPIGSKLQEEPEALSRNETISNFNEAVRHDKAMELIDRYECYVQIDQDGDGIAEWLQVIMAGGTGDQNVLAIELWGDPIPFAVLNPYPIPHRFEGRSVADDVVPIQQQKTVLLRQALDNIYAANNPMFEVVDGQIVNPDQLINPNFGEAIRVKTPNSITPISIPFVAQHAFTALEYLDGMMTKRTGISQQSMALDPDALQNQTATSAQLQSDASHSRQELIARNFAEGGFADLFSGLLQLVVKHQDRAHRIRLRNEWVDVDPRSWNAEMDVTISTGLGTGSKDRDVQTLMQYLGLQKEVIAQYGPDNPVVNAGKVVNTMRALAKSTGLKNIDQYIGNPTDEELQAAMQAQQSKPDPKAEAEKAKLEMQKAKMEAEGQMAQAKMQAEQQAMQMKMQMDQQRFQMEQQIAQAKLQAEQAKAQGDAQAAQAKLQQETMMAQTKLKIELEIAKIKADAEAQSALQIAEAKAQADLQVAIRELELKREMRLAEMGMERDLRLAQMQAGQMQVSANIPRVQ